ncbi:hypothetical protein ODZ84_04990 [Chryseobacterium fluminis]|uniref:hypothetical protein n=1 Tax=Chryseobacterium fluminis TaxID=2983606 RepID=UPI0022526AC9|nr:hypothetical protein [Chryseobacterium sp. MMS21-Ot14]UZT98929.1 hypothetical protein ODZ84_04990 [Chryseobacterium sp. MMS21-Ot14]
MRQFVDNSGRYMLIIPPDWVFKNDIYAAKNSASNCFEPYENPIGSFQISCHLITNNKTNIKSHLTKFIKHDIPSGRIDFKEKFIPDDEIDAYIWEDIINDNYLSCTYTYESVQRGTDELKEELDKVRFCLSSIRMIDEKYKDSVLNSYRFNQFMNSYAASVDLLQRAYDNGSAIEITVLLSNQIDASLRLVLILKKQLDDKSNIIDTTLIYQREHDKPVMEKQVYRMALENGIINKDLHDKLYILYDQRNKVIHRYIITDLLTKNVFETAFEYSQIEKQIGKIVKEYEQMQYIAKIGIYGIEESPDKPLSNEEQDELLNSLKEKHAHVKINSEITFKKFNLNSNNEKA